MASYTYGAYGEVLTATGYGANAALAGRNPLRYRGYYYDTATGLYYLPVRYYDPGTCRFLSADPAGPSAGDPLTLNAYAYCAGDPVNLEDPSGAAHVCDSGGGGRMKPLTALKWAWMLIKRDPPSTLRVLRDNIGKPSLNWLKERYRHPEEGEPAVLGVFDVDQYVADVSTVGTAAAAACAVISVLSISLGTACGAPEAGIAVGEVFTLLGTGFTGVSMIADTVRCYGFGTMDDGYWTLSVMIGTASIVASYVNPLGGNALALGRAGVAAAFSIESVVWSQLPRMIPGIDEE